MSGRVIRLKEVTELTGLSRSAIYDRMSEKSPRYDPSFPKQFTLGGKAVGWLKLEVDIWVETCAARQRGEAVPAPVPVVANKDAQSRRVDQTVSPRSPPVQDSRTSDAQPPTLADAIIEGRELVVAMRRYLAMEEWTPAMGAMLAAGLLAPVGSADIPTGELRDLIGRPVRGIGMRYSDAKRILREWGYQDDAPKSVHPTEFLCWCIEERIETVWLGLFTELLGCSGQNDAEIINARISMFLSSAING